MNNPTVSITTEISLSSIVLFENESFDIFVKSRLFGNGCTVTLREDGTLLICASNRFVKNIRVTTYAQEYGE